VKITRIYTGADGESHFEDLEIPQNDGPYGAISDIVPSTGVFFRTTPPGQLIDYHTAPRRQFVITLAGVAEIETGDGSTRRLGPGDILLADDTTGHGHISRDVEGPRLTIFVPIPDDLDISTWRAS
jgi:hypothetical protein